MTYERLKAELRLKGCSKTQVESKLVSMVADILTDANGEVIRLQGIESDIREALNHLHVLEFNLIDERKKIADAWDEFSAAKLSTQTYIDNFNDALMKLETAEARDAMKTAQVFVNTVNVDTKYDNTAFINGLAAILTGKQINGIGKFEKVESPTKRQGKRL